VNFNLTTLGSGQWDVFGKIAGWETTRGDGIEVRNNIAGHAYEGSHFIELDSNNNSSMVQTISTTTKGQKYDLSFWYSPRPDTSGFKSNTNDIKVFWDGKEIDFLTGSNSTSDNVWQEFTVKGLLGTGKDRLRFAAAGKSDSFGGSLDNVSLVSAVPEPETYAMFLAGLGMMGFMSRRRSIK
jgi:hypothetical protein